MICRKCGISHDNVGGYCPNCHALPQLIKQQLKWPLSNGFCTEVRRVCESCGKELSGKLICLSDENATLLGLGEYFLPDDHDCSQKHNFLTSHVRDCH